MSFLDPEKIRQYMQLINIQEQVIKLQLDFIKFQTEMNQLNSELSQLEIYCKNKYETLIVPNENRNHVGQEEQTDDDDDDMTEYTLPESDDEDEGYYYSEEEEDKTQQPLSKFEFFSYFSKKLRINVSRQKELCTICQYPMVFSLKTSCHHFYHPKCLYKCTRVKNCCPLCRGLTTVPK